MCFGIQEEDTFEFVYFGLDQQREESISMKLTWSFSLGKDGVKSHQDENAGIRFDFVLHFHVFHHENQFLNQNKLKHIRFILVSSETVTTRDSLHFRFRFWLQEAAMPTGITRKTNAKQQRHCTLLGVCVCVCCVEKGKL